MPLVSPFLGLLKLAIKIISETEANYLDTQNKIFSQKILRWDDVISYETKKFNSLLEKDSVEVVVSHTDMKNYRS